jgi:NADH-quinone oxidoreductase subunit G
MTDKVTIHVDGVAHEVKAGINLLEACLALKMDMPYFCWHPAMGSAGSCRQCAVIQYQNAEDTRGRLVMSCMTPVNDGMIVSMANEKATTFRATAIEAIMTNHPHDCPVCEEGGDCHLQDMTLISGHISRQYSGTKRTHLNQYLGPFLNHEMNRCIGCYRCVRFYKDYCGGDDFNVFSSRNQIYFGRGEPGELENEFSGNLAEVCPTGVFTDKTFSKHYSRKWDMATAPTICTNCSVGCNTYTAERGGTLRRVTNRYNPEVNAHFLCDRGRFGYEHVNHNDRLEQPWQRNNEQQKVEVLTDKAAEKQLFDWFGKGDTVVVGSTRSSIENNAALLKLVGQDNFYAGVSDRQVQQLNLLTQTYNNSDLSLLSLSDIEKCDAILMAGEDVTHTAPRLALSIRQMTRNAGIEKAAKMRILPWQDEAVRNIAQDLRSPLHILNTHASRLADVAKTNINLHPARQLALLLEVEALLKNPDDKDIASEQAICIADDLRNAAKPAIVSGTNSDNPQILATCLRIALLLKDGGLYCATGQANSLAMGILCNESNGLEALVKRIEDQPPSTLIIMETDLYRYFDDGVLDNLLDKVEHIVVLEQLLTRTAQMADLVLPVTSFAESHGCWLNAEGRLQKSYSTMPAIKSRCASFAWIQSLTNLQTNEQAMTWCADTYPEFAPLKQFINENNSDFAIARQPLRSTGRTAINAGIDVKEYPPAQDNGSQLEFSMEGVPSFRQKELASITSPPTGVWSPKWNSGQGVNKSLDDADNCGVTIFDDSSDGTVDLSPTHSAVSSDGLSICPRHHIYADDELAAYSTSLQQLIPTAKVSLNATQAQTLGINGGDTVCLKSAKTTVELPCSIEPDIADNVLLVPMQQYLQLGAGATLSTNSRRAE